MKTKTFQLKEILPNPFRDLEKNPLVEETVLGLMESIKTTNFWEDKTVRINKDSDPELVAGHHTLAALRRVYPSTTEFDWKVESLTDGQMIQRMARENATQRKPDVATLFEVIRAGVQAHGAGKIKPEEMPYKTEQGQRSDVIRVAPGYSARSRGSSSPGEPLHPYTVHGLADFLGMLKPDGKPRHSFEAAFGALELISEKYLTEAQVREYEIRKLGEVVASVKQQRDAALEQAKRLAAEATRKEDEAFARAAAEVKRKEEEEVRRKATVEAERVAAVKRAEEKAKRDAEEKIRLAAEAKRREEEAKQRVIAEEKRKKEETEKKAAAEVRRKEEEEKQRKIREAQQAEAKKRAEEAEHQRQIALAKAKKEEDERKAAQMIRDAEAAKARADEEAKRKVEAARQAEIAAKKKIEDDRAREAAAAKKREDDEKARQAAAAKKRADDAAHEVAQRKAQQESEARKETERAETARLKIIADKKAAAEAARKAQAEIDRANLEAKKKKDAAEKEEAAAKAHVKAVAAKLADEAKTMNRDDIRMRGQQIAEEKAAATGQKAAARKGPWTPVDSEFAKQCIEDMKRARASEESRSTYKPRDRAVPKNVSKLAQELVEFSYREFAKKMHPDHGGSHEGMQLLNATVAWLRLIIEEKRQ